MPADRYIEAVTVAAAYLAAVEYLVGQPDGSAVHLVVRILDPMVESSAVDDLVDGLLAERGLRTLNTVVNTLFPTSFAERHPDPVVLSERYRRHYSRIRRLNGNSDTYFGRLVAHPVEGRRDAIDQFSHVAEKLRDARVASTMTSRYEVAVATPAESANVYSPTRDRRKVRGFPCLSFLSFHLTAGRLHLTAHYRNHQFVARAYGNYLGLARLLRYLAHATGWDVGELLVVSGHAEIETAGKRRMSDLVANGRSALCGSSTQVGAA